MILIVLFDRLISTQYIFATRKELIVSYKRYKTSYASSGKAFEYACVMKLQERLQKNTHVSLLSSVDMSKGKRSFENLSDRKQATYLKSAQDALTIIFKTEPTLFYATAHDTFCISMQTDGAGVAGDVRDVIISKAGTDWTIGLSCKHNHYAAKHSRISKNNDFGKMWLGHGCSDVYFAEIKPVFTDIEEMASQKTPVHWHDIEDVNGVYLSKIQRSFGKELKRLSLEYKDAPKNLVHYMMGRNDFYKVICDEKERKTTVQGINLNGTLNKACNGYKPQVTVPVVQLPTTLEQIGFTWDGYGKQSKTTLGTVFDNGWYATLRLHTASKNVEPSLKFDIQMKKYPKEMFTQTVRL